MSEQETCEHQTPESESKKYPQYVLVADVNKIKDYIFASVRLRHIVNASALLAYVNEELTKKAIEEEFGGELIFTGGGITQATFQDECQANECAQKLKTLYPKETIAATVEVGVECCASEEHFVDAVEGARRKVREAKEAGGSEQERPFDSIPFSGGAPFFRICAQTGKAFATRWGGLGPEDEKQAFGENAWKQNQTPPKHGDIDHKQGDRLEADPELRKRLSDAINTRHADKLKASEIKINADTFKYSADLEKLSIPSKPQNYLGFMDADGNGMGEMLSQLSRECATEKDYRAFSKILKHSTRDAYLEAAVKVLVPFLEEQIDRGQFENDGSLLLPVRLLVMGGDDVTVVSLPQFILPLTNEFCREFQAIAETKRKNSDRPIIRDKLDPFTMSAGVVIAHRGFPFLSFRRLGNSLLKSAKKRSWAARRDEDKYFGSVDYQLITASGADDLKRLRKDVYTLHYKDEPELSLTGKPYLVSPQLDELRRLRHAAAKMKRTQISRRQIQGLNDVLRRGKQRGALEFLRWFGKLRELPETTTAQQLVERDPDAFFRYIQKETLSDLLSRLLFSVELEIDLGDTPNIPLPLRNQFEACGIRFSDNVKITVQRKGSRWLIADREQIYIVQKDQKLVSGYRMGTLCPSPWLDDDRIGKKPREIYTPLLDAVELFDLPDNLAEAEIELK